MVENILGKRMKSLRERRNLKQNQVAEKLGVSPYQLSRYESGKTKPDPDMIASIANYYEVTTDYLLGQSENPRMTEDEEFQAFANDPSLGRWYRELPESDEEDLRKLRQMWEIIKSDSKNK